MTARVQAWVLSAALSIGAGQSAMACAFHGYTPDPTLVDHLLMTEQVVLARPDPANPRRYLPVQTLMGPVVTEIAIPVQRAFRARLSASPSDSVLLARDGAYGPWVERAVVDDRYRALVERVLQRQSAWLYGGEEDRLVTFAKHLNDPSPDIRRLALRELDRAPYGSLARLRLPKVQGLQQDLENGEADLLPIRILLAGLSGDDGYTSYLVAELDRAIVRDLPYLGAYATALIELEGKAAVQDIVDRHLRNENLPESVNTRLLEALAIQYRASPRALRRFITREVAGLVRSRPDLSAIAARQFGFDRLRLAD